MKRWVALPLLLVPVAVAVLTTRATGAPSAAERGKYLVTICGCWDCHTPHKPGPKGIEPDRELWLAGHQASLTMPPAPTLPEGPWRVSAAGTLTAWAGPWGTSFSANLTPDPETGLGEWSEAEFIAAIRTGRHAGTGRPILPPMPIGAISQMTDEDLAAVVAYLKTVKPIKNRVPDPVPPAGK